MRRTKRAAALATATTAALIASTALQISSAYADPPTTPNGHANGHAKQDVREVGPDYNNGKPLRLEQKASAQARQQAQNQARPVGRDKVGDTKTWLALDDLNGIYLKTYTLRGVGDHIQVWVADDRAFPGDDCRNALGLTDITDAQVASFVHEFDTNIYPTESQAFSVAPDRNGKQARTDLMGLPNNYFQTTKQGADDTVVLVDNVRDANFYTPSEPAGQTYIAGFFYSVFNEYTDRNIMTIDAYDWLHRTGATPPNDADDPAYEACPYASGAPRPHLYEGTFAHEYQHLLEYYQDPDEVSWVNEGLSDYAQTLVGYVDPSTPVNAPGADSHIACFSGFLADQGYGGPENSLTQWQDQGGPEILCDYGAAYSFMQYLYGHYGEQFVAGLHREPGNGLTGLQNALTAAGSPDTAMDVLHRWAAMWALDNVVSGGATLTGGDPAAYTEDSLGAQINWDAVYDDINHDGTPGDVGNEAYSTEGAPPNGSDYVRLRDGAGNALSAGDLTSLDFTAPGSLPTTPLEWTVDATSPDATTADTTCGKVPDGSAGAAFYSGCGASLDRSMVRTVSVPADNPTLTFKTLYDTEPGWDFGFVQVFDPATGAYTSLPCTGTTSEHDPGAIPAVQANVPGYSGDSGGWVQASCDLSAYAGQDVELAFRYVTDTGVNEAGWWVDDITVGGTTFDGSSLDGWQSATQAHPSPVGGFTVQLVAYTDDGTAAWVGQLPVTKGTDGMFHGSLSGTALAEVVGSSAQTVSALVMQDDPTETVDQYARYALTANTIVQPGG
ncbi:MAG TPA: choice-of-anchor J domain-containing protein [Marmoricola sp.]|nr:choice-of-anchor J domain-containing protein [Marmoricola sp.]